MINLIWPNEKEINPEMVGGKAWNLIQLFKAGFNVPKFFVITTNVFNTRSFYLEEEFLENLEKLNSLRVAVRSSATCEDQADSSFAGQFESFLGVSREELLGTVKSCWEKVKSERVIDYAKSRHLCLKKVSMAVIIQEMIFAEKGGVIFTENVFEKKKEELIIEAASGLGEKIVSGLVDPQRIIINKKTKEIKEIDSPEGEILNADEIEELINLSLKIEKFYGIAQDIEWAIYQEKVYVLQSRPITA